MLIIKVLKCEYMTYTNPLIVDHLIWMPLGLLVGIIFRLISVDQRAAV